MAGQPRRFAAKRLSQVEIDPTLSNQHEFNGAASLRDFFGEDDHRTIDATFIWVGKSQTSECGHVSWYDARKNISDRAAEWRLYYSSNGPVEEASPGDYLIIAQHPNSNSLLILLVDQECPFSNHITWMLGLDEDLGDSFQITTLTAADG